MFCNLRSRYIIVVTFVNIILAGSGNSRLTELVLEVATVMLETKDFWSNTICLTARPGVVVSEVGTIVGI